MMDDRKLGYVIQTARLSVTGHVWSEDAHQVQLQLLEKACQQAAEKEDYNFFASLKNALEHTSDRLAPPSSVRFKREAMQMVDKYGPQGNDGALALEKVRYRNYLNEYEHVVASGQEAGD